MHEKDVVQFLEKNPKMLDSFVAKRVTSKRFISWAEEKSKQKDEAIASFVAKFLETNAKFLEHFVSSNVRSEVVRQWLELLERKSDSRSRSVRVSQRDRFMEDLKSKAEADLEENDRLLFGDKDLAKGLIKKILAYSKHILLAERTSLFLFDEANHELVAEYYQYDDQLYPYGFEIRQPATSGIAGTVFQSRQLINLPDCYKDPRFNKEIDSKTGYITRNMLCYPVAVSDQVLGVLEARNRIGFKHFTVADERAIELIDNYCAVALKLGKVNLNIKNREERLNTTMRTLYGHSNYRQKDYQQLVKDPGLYIMVQNLDRFSFNYLDRAEFDLARSFCYMYLDVSGPDNTDVKRLCSFIMTVNSNYRNIPYHNFHHAFNVAHTLYLMLKGSPNIFPAQDLKTLLVAAVCHDLNHMGFNNQYLAASRSALAALYPTSTLERHHLQIAISILQVDKHNIFFDLKPKEFKQALDLMAMAILSTDLANYNENKTQLQSLTRGGDGLDLTNPAHRESLIKLMMVGADLSASCKPWKIQLRSVHELYEEFYKQGDYEKQRGLQPIPMMNREAMSQIPKDQVGFINFLCQPCYALLAHILPVCEALLDQLKENLDLWKNLAEEAEREKQNDS